MADKHTKLVSQTGSVADTALLTLAARTAQDLQTSFTGITATFLIKRIRFWLKLIGRTAGDDGPLFVGICPGDISVSEIALAINEANTAGPGDTTQRLTQDNAWSVSRWSFLKFEHNAALTEGELPSRWLNAPGKGWAAKEGTGWKTFIFNAGNGSLTTGITIGGLTEVQGVWLRD